jgi:hypothetical protein
MSSMKPIVLGKSRVLGLDPVALIGKNLLRVFEILQAGIASAGHAEFVRMLQK